MDLLTLDRAKLQLPNAPSDGSDDALIAQLVTACSSTVENYTNCRFALTDYDELYNGNNTVFLLLNNRPVTQIKYVRYGRRGALQINYSNSQVQQATVQVSSTGLTLQVVNNGAAASPVSLPFATYTTMTALATAISAVSGWSATAVNEFASWSSSELGFLPATKDARRGTAYLEVHGDYLSDYRVDLEGGTLQTYWGFWRGMMNFRIGYTAGYSTVPEEVQQATAELIQATYAAVKLNPNLAAQSLGEWSWTKATKIGFENLSQTALHTLQFYKRYHVGRFQY